MTTKRGAQGKMEVNYNGYVGIQSLWRNFDFYSPEEYVMLRREAMAMIKALLMLARCLFQKHLVMM